ncbi:MAG: signal peptidase I [Thermodesulfovibrionales bacterium]|nr:signal peptidase I [Thermodesulfovibrionales bacterium]
MKKKSANTPLSSKVLDTEKIALLEDILAKGLSIRIQVTGNSMTPFLRSGEILTIRKVLPGSLRIGDLIFFKTPEELPVLHRIIEKKRGRDNVCLFRTKGDAVSTMDELVTEHNILGKVCRVERTIADYREKHLDMELPIWKAMNFSLALVSLGKGKIASHPALAGLLRRIKKAFV